MAESRFCDCPGCGRTNVVGYIAEDQDERIMKSILTGGAMITGGMLGGPLGIGAGAMVGKFIEKNLPKIIAGNESVEFKFQCPSCGRRFSKYFYL